MTRIAEKLRMYAAYHRDRRNVATHFVGIPMIVVAIVTLLARPNVDVGGVPLSPALALLILSSLYYLWLEVRMGAALIVLNTLAWGLAVQFARQGTAEWLGWGVGLFVVGWAVQFIGHFWEGRKPAFVDDIIGLLIGPLFLLAEVVFALGLRADLRREVLGEAGGVPGGAVSH